jgi:hypothetical protein
MTNHDLLAEARKKHGVTTSEDAVNANEGLTKTDVAKLVAQGFSFNFSDEAIAGVKSIFSDKTYDELVNEERKVLNVAREKAPIEALGYEMGGAVLPSTICSTFYWWSFNPSNYWKNSFNWFR